jgi:DNA helicase-2/ATP-dependent DNA helicase PcrA
LEFDYVFVIGVNEGVLPHEKSMSREEEVEEERRLMYVAMTRARKRLYLLFHSFPSRFLYEIPKELYEFISPTGLWDGLPEEEDLYIE